MQIIKEFSFEVDLLEFGHDKCTDIFYCYQRERSASLAQVPSMRHLQCAAPSVLSPNRVTPRLLQVVHRVTHCRHRTRVARSARSRHFSLVCVCVCEWSSATSEMFPRNAESLSIRGGMRLYSDRCVRGRLF